MKKGITGDQIIASSESRSKNLFLGEYLAAGETMLLYAPTGQGKTINALMLAVALTTGGSFYDWKAHEKRKVLFVEGGELTAYGIAERMRDIYRTQGVTSDPNFHLKAPTKDESFTFNITDPEHQKILQQYIKEYGIECVIFDNFNSLRHEEENEFMAWNRLEKFLNRLRTQGVASVVIHHTNKEAKQQSGSQRKADYVDLVVRIQKSRLSTKKGKWDKTGKVYIEFEMQKWRWGESQELILSELKYHEGALQLFKVNYEEILTESIIKDLGTYGMKYVMKKYDYLGYSIYHYLKLDKALPEAPDTYSDYHEDMF